MKLDTTHMRYLTKDNFRVLVAVEMGSKNHEIVPTSLIVTISGLRNKAIVNKSISALAKIKLIVKERNASYDGYKLSYRGYDYLALRAMLQRKSIYAVGTQIGIGKESDIFTVANEAGDVYCLKVHRLGRISFRSVKRARDYLGKRQSASWMYLSRLAAEKEYKFLQVLHKHGFSVPAPIDNSRHQIVMSLIDGVLLRKLRDHSDPGRLYSLMMEFILRLANHGLIHCDFNEFNLIIRDYDEEHPDNEVVVIDFPQCVSIDHPDAKTYFERDVNGIRQFFKQKFDYIGEYPLWEDVKREAYLDVEAGASGNDKKALKELQNHFALLATEQEFSDFEASESDGDEFEEFNSNSDEESQGSEDGSNNSKDVLDRSTECTQTGDKN